jgi:hypothetical protein
VNRGVHRLTSTLERATREPHQNSEGGRGERAAQSGSDLAREHVSRLCFPFLFLSYFLPAIPLRFLSCMSPWSL